MAAAFCRRLQPLALCVRAQDASSGATACSQQGQGRLLERRFGTTQPAVVCPPLQVNEYSILFTWRGSNPELRPLL